jgi:hypothetical protein
LEFVHYTLSDNGYTKEEQTTQWTKEKGQMDKQRSAKHTYKTKDRVTQTLLTISGEQGNVYLQTVASMN